MRPLHAAFVLCALVPSVAAEAPKKTPLDDYLAKPDPTYAWKLVKTIPGDGVTSYVLDLKSQTWRSTPEVDRPVWQHWLTITKPDKVTRDTALLSIGGGRNGGAAPTAAPGDAIDRARRSGTVVVSLGQVPNQPLVFNKDGKERVEDDLLAYCHIKFLETGDATWVARLPMVKSAVKAMDAATEFLASAEGGKIAIKSFVVAGGSKRGWTTWLTGAVDPRVKAIIPIVIDVVNVRPSMMNHYAAYGFWAPAVGNYARQHKVMDRWDAPRMEALNKIEDPYFYLDRLTLPKYVVNAAGDQFFTPDSSKFYFDDLRGPKYLRYVPNGDHSLRGTDAGESILAFYRAIVAGSPLSKFKWKMNKDGSITVATETKPKEVNLWQATNPKARDFRLLTIGKAYRSSPLEADGKGVYVGRVGRPESGWTAFFVELVFDSGDEKAPYKFTTQVQVVPDVLPHNFEEFRKTLKGDVSVPIDPKLLAKLAEQLRSKNLDEPSAALATLEKMVPAKGTGKVDFGPVIEPLLDLSGWGGIARKDALKAERLIVRIGGQTAPSLRRRLSSHDAHDRRVAAELLARVEPAGSGLTELLRPLLADKDHYVRRAAMQGLGAQGPAAKAAISDLENEGADSNLPNQVTARVALIHIAGASKERVGALADLLRLKEPCDGAAAYAAAELGKLGRQAKSAAPQLLDALKHTDAQVRVEAAHALGRVGADAGKAVAALIGLLNGDPEREVRRSAAEALGEMGPAAAPAVPALREALRGDGGGWWVAADAIGKIGGPDAVPALVEALGSKDNDVRLTAIKRLGELGGAAASAAKALKKARKDDPQESNRKAAAEALKKITGRASPEER